MKRSFLIVLILASACSGAAPATQPALNIDELIAALSAEDWRVRESAQAKLAALDVSALPALEQAVKRAVDPEARARLEAAIHAICRAAGGRPTLVTLHAKDAPVDAVLKDLARQSGFPFALKKPSSARVSLDVQGKPVWLAIKQITQQTGLGPHAIVGSRESPGIVYLKEDSPFAKQPGMMSGLFYVAAEPTPTTVMLAVYGDPKARIIIGRCWVQVTEALDDRGRSLMIGDGLGPSCSAHTPWQLRAAARLAIPADAGQIALLRATIYAPVLCRWETWEVDLANATGATRTADVGTLAIQSFARRQAGNPGYELKATFTAAAAGETFPMGILPSDALEVLDSRGNPLRCESASLTDSGGPYGLSVVFIPREEPAAEPAKLRWNIPLEIREVAIPVEFTDLPLPRRNAAPAGM